MKFNIKNIIYLPIIFFFLPAFSLHVPGFKIVSNIYYIVLYIFLILIFIFDGKFLFNKFISVCKNTPLKYFILFLIFISVNSLILSLFGITTIVQTLRSILMQLVLCIMPTIIYFIYIITKYLGVQRFMKIFMLFFWINLVLGFVAYIGRMFDVTIINIIFDFLNNERILELMYEGTAEQTSETYFMENRLCGLFAEPGYLGQFLFIFLPFVYTFAGTKIKIFNNKLFNKIFKITIIPFTWMNIILTLSPIVLVFATIITIIYYLKTILKFINKYLFYILFIIILIITFSVLFVHNSVDLSDTYIIRIINVLTNIHSFEDFILVEPSLATRVASYINEIYIFIQHPFTGIGFGNTKHYMYNQFLNSPVPLTPEIITRTKLSIQMGNAPCFSAGFIYMILAEHGIFACLILIFYYIKTFKFIKFLQGFYDIYSYEYLMTKSLYYTLICLLILSIYNLNFLSRYLHLIIVLCSLCIYDYRTMLTKVLKEGE